MLAFFWRRRQALVVLAVACAAVTFAAPVGSVPVLVALYTAAPRLSLWRGMLAWSGVAAACMMVGSAVATGSFGPDQVVSGLTSAGTALGLGLYTGIRRMYLARLHERALFARALAFFLPPEVAELIEASPSALSLQGELEVTVLFSDIRGFSTFAEQVPPRQVAEVVGRHLGAMAAVVRAHGGVLDKFAGDAVMAVFGAPNPVADHAGRAVRCAVAMQRRQAELNAEARTLGLPTSDIGIGINTGSVIAGLIGGAGRVDYTVIGDAVNVAQRLQTEAKAGEILVSAATMQRCTWPGAQPAGTRLLKGRQQPVEVYRLQWEDRGARQASGDQWASDWSPGEWAVLELMSEPPWRPTAMDVPEIAWVTFTSEDRVREVLHNFNLDRFDSLYPRDAGGRSSTTGGGAAQPWPLTRRSITLTEDGVEGSGGRSYQARTSC